MRLDNSGETRKTRVLRGWLVGGPVIFVEAVILEAGFLGIVYVVAGVYF